MLQIKKNLARIEAGEMGNSQAVVEWVAIAALVLGVCAAGFAALGTANDALLDNFTNKVKEANNVLGNTTVAGA